MTRKGGRGKEKREKQEKVGERGKGEESEGEESEGEERTRKGKGKKNGLTRKNIRGVRVFLENFISIPFLRNILLGPSRDPS